jgi:phenylalanyl-tRNA synthetase alpha subunit
MELILAALIAGATAAAKDTASVAVKDAYNGLKALLKKKLGETSDLVDAVNKLEKSPDREDRKATVKTELEIAKVNDDPEIVKKAEELMKQEDPEGLQGGKYNIHITGGTQGVVGKNSGTVNMGK